MAPIKKAAVAAPAAKVTKKAAPEAQYALEVKSRLTSPIKVYGTVTETSDGFRIVAKRPRSSKADTLILQRKDVFAARLGPFDGNANRSGWILSDHPDFEPQVLNISLDAATVEGTEVWGEDPINGEQVFVNLAALPSAIRHVSYSE